MADSGGTDDDFYTVLGVDDDAAPDEIRAAYRERVKETHPDQSDASDASERFRRVKRAEEVLTDPAERARYDRLGHERYVADEAVGGGRGTEGPGDATGGGRSGSGSGDGDRREGGSGGGGDRHRGPGHRRRRDRESGDRRTHGAGRRAGGGGAGEGTGRGGRADGNSRGDGNSWGDSGSRGDGGSRTRTGGHRSTRGPAGAGAGGTDGAAGGAATDPVAEGFRRSVRFFDSRQLEIGASEAVFGFASFFLYPIFLASSVAPSFPLPVNLVLAICLLLTVGYLLATPEVGTVVFGAWTLFAPVLFLFTDQPLLSWAAFFLFAATAIPLGLSLVTREVLRAP